MTEPRATRRRRPNLTPYLLIGPALLAAVAFLYVPMAVSAYWSLTDYSGLAAPSFVGLRNYTELLSGARFRQALLNTTLFTVIGMSAGPALGLAAALLLNQRVRFVGVFRTVYFLPVTTSLVVTATVWKMLLNEDGILNAGLRLFGLPGHAWLADPATSLLGVAAASVWQGFGFETVVFLAALQSIPKDLYGAAAVDGAGPVRKFWHVTLPSLRPTLLFVFVMGIIGSFQSFDQMFVMTHGGPTGSTTTLVYYLIDRFKDLELGKASAVAYILFLILAVLSYLQLRGERR
ncbi:carbohydrate ABC transporter permease [Nonomuraea sp. CA-143628]|uniref:carbohydrate ABC transporter permease n=1 Tax=Nonomuraea sp. CA-143628 TaxID=3239997 RepID=UPI003D8C7710